MSKFTPGPWYESKSSNHQGLVISERTGDTIAVTYDKRDAALIAAAPEMYSALHALIYSPDTCADPLQRIIDQARAIIAKVEG